MEFYDVIEKRKTVREFLDKPVDFEKIKRILEAGNLAPTWNHNRNWSYIILHTDEEKEYAKDKYVIDTVFGSTTVWDNNAWYAHGSFADGREYDMHYIPKDSCFFC